MSHRGRVCTTSTSKVTAVTRGLRDRKKEQTRIAICGAALQLFERQGFEGTTVEDIAEAANVSSRTFFRYFDSKIDVILDHKHEDEESLRDLLMARPPEEAPIEAVHAVFRERLAEIKENPEMIRQFRVLMSSPTLRKLAAEHFQDNKVELVEAFAERLGVAPTDLAPRVLAAALSETIWVIIEGWVAAGSDPEQLGPIIDDAFTRLRAGFS
jgi:AcrR family transcriptional regulator